MKVYAFWLLLLITHPLFFFLLLSLDWFPEEDWILPMYVVISLLNVFVGLRFYKLPMFDSSSRWSVINWLLFVSGILLWSTAFLLNLIVLPLVITFWVSEF